MKINSLYVGGWFQRTMLQLNEVYDFVRGDKSKLRLNHTKLDALREGLNISSVDYNVSGQEYLEITTTEGFDVKFFEDGLITLSKKNSTKETLFEDLHQLSEYYERKFGAAINYLFSLGAPVPKEMTQIEKVYPYFVVCEGTSNKEMIELLETADKKKYFEFNCDRYSVVRGDKFYFINDKKAPDEIIERYIEEQIFIREFKDQLHKYLNVHRTIWEKIEHIKAKKTVKGEDIVKTTTKIETYAQTIGLIEGRINQMSTYIDTRASIAKNDPGLKEFLAISGYRYDTLKNTLDYIKSLWDMSKNHLSSIQRIYSNLQGKVTNKSVKSLTMVSTISATASIIALTMNARPSMSWFGFVYISLVIGFGWWITKYLKKKADKNTYLLSEAEIEGDINK